MLKQNRYANYAEEMSGASNERIFLMKKTQTAGKKKASINRGFFQDA
ncbi:hypothetical protein [Shewanella fidelis]|uniref:Uncharacterized protein n=1 Tax=Shewanella fidelis TaxID=173509 RepID=A0AAW8NQR5_9GAMM|nr:hypothetical protein [Shewanella fidelis]MDR8525433.1 hypothetical protein [Shewanella fidelis]MDW4813231.1 hypothetical protein [Shewanella fidelis]MDW4816872.1 hypothetical protein [Shewanella fidelis]MDW4820048.1 hypothetical protein [Shewanella fidelis]MDW4825713.1 hypothetical protein [Shewanella fidelis]